jgi:hypothetical protein
MATLSGLMAGSYRGSGFAGFAGEFSERSSTHRRFSRKKIAVRTIFIVPIPIRLREV